MGKKSRHNKAKQGNSNFNSLLAPVTGVINKYKFLHEQAMPKNLPMMPDKWYNVAKDIFSIPSTEYNHLGMSVYILNFIREMDVIHQIDSFGNIIISKGNAPIKPCFTSHMDTVHMYNNGFNLVEYTKVHTYLKSVDDDGKQVGVGGDDKCGIFACLYLLSILENVKIVFFVFEESGAIGSHGINLGYFHDVAFIGGIDRWGCDDFITSYFNDTTASEGFLFEMAPYLSKYEYKDAHGIFTDAFALWSRNVGVTVFNMSCGYYSHHSDKEYVSLNELWQSCLLAEEIGFNCSGKYPSSYEFGLRNKYGNMSRGKYSNAAYGYADGFDSYLAGQGHTRVKSGTVVRPGSEMCKNCNTFPDCNSCWYKDVVADTNNSVDTGVHGDGTHVSDILDIINCEHALTCCPGDYCLICDSNTNANKYMRCLACDLIYSALDTEFINGVCEHCERADSNSLLIDRGIDNSYKGYRTCCNCGGDVYDGELYCTVCRPYFGGDIT
jgi:putative aminopeptidase FrvX